MSGPVWSVLVTLAEISRGRLGRRLWPDDAQRAALAAFLKVDALERLSAEITAVPWLDGAALNGAWSAAVTQTCGVTLEPFTTELSGDFQVRVLPAGSPNALPPEEGEIAFDAEADDPPDVLDGEIVDLAAYVLEHLSLEIDPFPRKPGAVFDEPEPDRLASPFAVLSALKGKDG